MNLLNLLNTFTEQAPFLLIITALYIITIIYIKVLKKEIYKLSTYIIRGISKILIVSIIPTLIIIYYSIIAATSFVSSSVTSSSLSLLAIISLNVSILLGIVILFMESERFISSLTKEIENLNINNWEKITIKLLNVIQFILSIILIYSILFLAIYPTNIILINIILIISQVYLFMIIFDMIFSILAAILSKELKLNINIGKI
jgi:hypothetical protein